MAGNAGSSGVSIFPEFTGFRSKVTAEVDTAAQESGNRFTRSFGNGVKGIGALVGKSLLAAGAVTSAVAAIAIKGGISRQLQIEDATAKLSGLGNSTAKVKTIMDNALASVKGTAFGMGEAATVAAGATAAGITPGKELERILKLTGDAATIAGTSMGEMGSIFNKVASTGKLTGDVVAQLQDRGFPILQMVADKYGVTAEAASKMVSEGKVNFADFASAIETNVGGAALKSGNTTKGAFKNMTAALSRVGVTMSSGFFPLVKGVFNQVTTILDGVNAKVKPTAEAFGTWFQGKAGPAIANFSTVALAWFDKVFKASSDLYTGLSMGAAQRLNFSGKLSGLVAFGAGFRAVIDETIGGFRALRAAFQDGGDDITSSGFAGAMEWIGITARKTWDAAGPIFVQIGQGIKGMFSGLGAGDLTGAGASFVSIFGAIGNIAKPMGPILVGMGSSLGDVGIAIGKLVAGALPLVAPLLKIVTDALGFLADHTEILTPLVIGLGAAWVVYKIGQTAANVASIASLPIKAAGVAANLALANSNVRLAAAMAASTGAERAGFMARLPATAQVIAQTAANIGSRVAMAAGAVATGIATAAQWAWNAALSANPIALVVIAIAALVAGLVWFFTQTQLGKDIFANTFAFIQQAVNGFLTWWTTAFWPGVQTVLAFFQPAFAAVQAVIGIVFGYIQATIQNAMTVVQGIIQVVTGVISGNWSQVWSGIRTILGGVWAQIQNVINTGINLVRAFISGGLALVSSIFSSIWNGIVSFVSGIPGRILAGIAAIASLAATVGGWINGVKDAAVAKFLELVSWVAGVPGQIVAGLSGLAGQMITVGQNIVQGLIDGARGMIDSAVQAVKDVGGSMLKGIQDFLGIHSPSREFMKIGRWVTEGLAKGVGQKTSTAVKAITGVADKLRDAAAKRLAPKNLAAASKAYGAAGVRQQKAEAAALNRSAAQVSAQVATLTNFAKRREALAARLKTSQKQLSDAIAVRNKQAAESTKTLTGEFKLSDLVGRSASTIRAVATGIASRIKAFGAKMATLRKLGLHPALIAEVGSLGSEDGSAVADALIKGGKGEVAGINSAYNSIGAYAKGAGAAIADGMYGAGINGLQGLVNGFAGNIKAIDQAAKKVTDRLTSQVKKNLGIRSPSRVFRFEVGQMAGEGMALGIEDMTSRIQAASERMAAIPAAVTAAPVSQGATAAASGGTVPGGGTQFVFTGDVYGDPEKYAGQIETKWRRASSLNNLRKVAIGS